MLSEGTKAPPLDLADQDGKITSLSDFAGRWVILWWFVKASTPG